MCCNSLEGPCLCIRRGPGLKLDANELLKLGIVDRVLEEPVGGAHRDWDATAQELQDALISELENLEKIPAKDLPNHRYEKFRKMGKVL